MRPTLSSWALKELRANTPLVVVLHGFCERGRPRAVLQMLPTWLTESTHVSLAVPVLQEGLWCEETLARTIRELVDRHSLLSVRLLGISIGGSAVWNLLALEPLLFESAVVLAATPSCAVVLDVALGLIGLRLRRRSPPASCTAKVTAYVGALDPLLAGAHRVPRFSTLVTIPWCGHRVWDEAFRDPSVRSVLVGEA